MAKANFSHSFNMDDNTTQAGFTTVETSSLMRLEDQSNDVVATLRQDYGGSGFTFDSQGHVTGGVITSFAEFSRPSPASPFDQTVTFTGLNVDVTAALNALQSGDINQFYSLFFNSADQFSGSPENDVMNSFGGQDFISAGAGNDVIRAGSGSDVIEGGSGNDIIDGGAGFDAAIFSGPRSAYTITRTNGNWTFSGPDGTDSVTSVEKAVFSDGASKWLGSVAHASGADFDGDGRDDILWRNDDGRPSIWTMNDLNIQAANVINGGVVVPNNWVIAGSGDFNGDGKGDILWRADDGTPSIWMMNGLSTQTANVINGGVQVPTDWSIAGTGDFDGDGKTDILWRNDNDGRPSIWTMNGLNTQTANVINGGVQVPNDWSIVGTGDFNGDGKSDILWRNDSGQLSVWQMNGLNTIAAGLVNGGVVVPNDWKVVGIGDFNGDGKADILWRNDDGRPSIWEMNGQDTLAANLINGGTNVPNSWSIVGTGDFNGDAKADILWRDDAGQPAVWEMNGLNTLAANLVNGGVAVPNDWIIT